MKADIYTKSLTTIFTLISGALLMKIGHYQPFLFIGGIFITIGSGLIYTLDINSPASKYVGYQLLAGIGDGLAVQVPVTVCQAPADPVDIPGVTGLILCTLKHHLLCFGPFHSVQNCHSCFFFSVFKKR